MEGESVAPFELQETVKTRTAKKVSRKELYFMKFDELLRLVPKLGKLGLPGEQAQDQMAPPLRRKWMESQREPRNVPREAGVLALFYPGLADETHLLFILRKTYSGVHSGQMAFPGGKREQEDLDLWATALRESEEEVGLPRQEVQFVRSLTEVYIPPSNFLVQPFLGLSTNRPVFVPEEKEVERIIEVPFSELFSAQSRIQTSITTSYARAMKVPAYQVHNQIIWGATAMMLSEIEALLQNSH